MRAGGGSGPFLTWMQNMQMNTAGRQCCDKNSKTDLLKVTMTIHAGYADPVDEFCE